MSIVRFISITTILFVQLFILIGCSNQKLRLSLEEISRPLSLPPENWRVGLKTGTYFSLHEKSTPFNLEFTPTLIYPYFQLGSRWEYSLPAQCKFYIVKQTEIKDSVIYITGANCAISAGCIGFYYSDCDGLSLALESKFDYKVPISDKVWLLSNITVDYRTNYNNFGGNVTVGCGYQISKHFYTTFEPSIAFYKYRYFDYSFRDYYLEEYTRISIPMLIGVNITKRWSLDWQNGVCNYTNGHWVYNTALGFSYSG